MSDAVLAIIFMSVVLFTVIGSGFVFFCMLFQHTRRVVDETRIATIDLIRKNIQSLPEENFDYESVVIEIGLAGQRLREEYKKVYGTDPSV